MTRSTRRTADISFMLIRAFGGGYDSFYAEDDRCKLYVDEIVWWGYDSFYAEDDRCKLYVDLIVWRGL